MKKLAFVLIMLMSLSALSQDKYFTKTGTTEFKASVDTFEPVEAVNKSTTAILNTENGNIAALLFVKAFHFEIALMEEHFNENYMDSDKFPKATFKGKIQGFDSEKLTENPSEFTIKGILNVRGIDKEIEAIAKLSKVDEKILLEANFSVLPQDFKIGIPKIVRKKIAKKIHLNLNYELIQKN